MLIAQVLANLVGKASVGAKNDLAYALMKLGKFDEAEPFAREAVRAYGENWNFRETLAAILIAAGKTDEGERELGKAEELADLVRELRNNEQLAIMTMYMSKLSPEQMDTMLALVKQLLDIK